MQEVFYRMKPECSGGTGDGGELPLEDPCEKTKAMLQKPDVKTKIDSLKNKSTTAGELGIKIKNDGTTSGYIVGGAHKVDLGNLAGWQMGYHNHTSTGIPMHSPPDIAIVFSLADAQPQLQNTLLDAALGMIVKKPCATCPGGFKVYHFLIRFNGDSTSAQTTFSEDSLKECNKFYAEQASLLSINSMYSDDYLNLNYVGVEKLLFDTLATMDIPQNQIVLQRIEQDSSGAYNKVYNVGLDVNGTPVETPCL